MVYIITQTKGHLADAANEMWEVTCQNPNEEKVRELLSKYRPDLSGNSSFFYNGSVDCWWKFNASSAISQKIELSDEKLSQIYQWCLNNGHGYDDRAERWIVSELKKKFPDCEWSIHYEY